MSKLFYKGMVEDIQSEKCTDAEIEALLAAFDYTVKRTATTLARKAWFALEDYATSKERGIDRFMLVLYKETVNGQEQWHGTFEYGGKKLKVIATLEKN